MWSCSPASCWPRSWSRPARTASGLDYFRADKAWWYITLLTIGYMIARGLAKSGSREPYDDDRR